MNVDMGLCDVAGCGKPAVRIYTVNLSLNASSSVPSRFRSQQRCAEHDDGISTLQLHNPADVAEIEQLRAEVKRRDVIILEVARNDDIYALPCRCRDTLPMGHHDGCYILDAHTIAHVLHEESDRAWEERVKARALRGKVGDDGSVE